MAEVTNNSSSVPSSRLTTTLLNDRNFQSWARAAILSLNERDLYENVTGDAKMPDKEKANAEYKNWKKSDLKAMNSLIQSIEPNMIDHFLYTDTAKEMWDAINKHFSKKSNHTHIYHLKKEIHQSLKKTEPSLNT
ncbi:gag-polypeptide of LTR copia-type [Carex littledalei]|uniref:Gag-polypeptide of LTR copia-type n=1 Tax=Carex littledalei TaxID=544730 RepID=A0A833V9G7_9POAL|nr:gag-polypeptide of LTR copia-type [Carex littledalei]